MGKLGTEMTVVHFSVRVERQVDIQNFDLQ